MSRQTAKDHQLILMPRDHGKSRYAGFFALWQLTCKPSLRVLYISSTGNLAQKQLGFIKDIMQNPIYRKYWPEMTHPDEGKRKRWSMSEIMVDHYQRLNDGIRDPSIDTAGLERSITGLHFDLAILDDVVVQENAYSEEGRSKVKTLYSLLSSIEAGMAREVAVGTRYHPLDLYSDMLSMEYTPYDSEGNELPAERIYEVFERQVEDSPSGDGSGQFLWPVQITSTGVRYGFDRNMLAKKRAKYLDPTQFRAQYYNDPNDTLGAAINRAYFQYYDKEHLKYDGRNWHYKGDRLNIAAAVDFAGSTSKRSDYTAIAVVGMNSRRQVFVLDIDRFKTNEIKDYYNHILELYKKWDFRRINAETTSLQEPIVKELKSSYIVPSGIMLSVLEHKPSKADGAKEQRISAILEPLYQNQAIWHYRGGHCQTLEDELVLQFPPHDDVKDAVGNAVNILVPPNVSGKDKGEGSNVFAMTGHRKFGGLG